MNLRKEIQHIYLVGAKSLGAYGGYETFVLSKSKMAQRFQAFLFLSKLPTRYPFPQMSFCSTVLNIHLPLQTLKFIACCWTVMKLNRLSLSAFTESQIARSQYLTIICSEIFQYLRIGANHFALIHSCPADVKSWTTFFTNKFEKKQKNKPYKAFSRYRTALSLVGLNCYSI